MRADASARVGGTRAAFLIEHPSLALPSLFAPRIARVIQEGLTEFPLTDRRRALHAYANHRELGIQWSGDHSRATVTGPGLTGEIGFDELARMTSMDLPMGNG